MSLLFIYALVTFGIATLALKYYNIYTAGAVVGGSVGVFLAIFGSAIGHNVGIVDAVRNVLLLGIVGSMSGAVVVELVFIGLKLASMIAQEYLEFVTH